MDPTTWKLKNSATQNIMNKIKRQRRHWKKICNVFDR